MKYKRIVYLTTIDQSIRDLTNNNVYDRVINYYEGLGKFYTFFCNQYISIYNKLLYEIQKNNK